MCFPLLPWMHGSEANEHVFGFLRSLVPDFTMLNVLHSIPKLGVRLMAACKAKNVQVDFRRMAAGYSHTYFDANDIPLGILSKFPSDHDITQTATIAFDEANTLCVKTLQGLGVLDVSVVTVNARVQWIQWVDGSEEGEKPKLDRGEEECNGLQVIDEDKTKVQLQLLPDTYS